MWCGGVREEPRQSNGLGEDAATGSAARSPFAVILGIMARGWESKAVEDQQAEARRPVTTAPPMTEDERAKRQACDGLRLALADTTAQLQAACRAEHRDMLRQKIVALEARLAQMQGAPGPRLE